MIFWLLFDQAKSDSKNKVQKFPGFDFLVANTLSRSMLCITVIKQKVTAKIKFRNFFLCDFLIEKVKQKIISATKKPAISSRLSFLIKLGVLRAFLVASVVK
ncbi:MAG: hypothetical protein JNJ41_14405 [Bacteroidia bacterium]|nr:hypothetical protein [Bacteroidia bacterium]